jgi:hypothetical protein
MSEVKALFRIGKTQWRKWNDDQRTAFNEAMAEGVPFGDAVAGANQTQHGKPKKNVLDVLGDVVETAVAVSSVVGAAEGTVKVVKRAVRGKKAK